MMSLTEFCTIIFDHENNEVFKAKSLRKYQTIANYYNDKFFVLPH